MAKEKTQTDYGNEGAKFNQEERARKIFENYSYPKNELMKKQCFLLSYIQ